MKLTKNAIIFFVISLIILLSSVFAWINISKLSDVGSVDSNITEYRNLIYFYVKKNDNDFIEVGTLAEINAFFENTKPGDYYEFKVEFKNTTSTKRSFMAEFKSIITAFADEDTEDYDLKDVFYIDQGKVDINFYKLDGQETFVSYFGDYTVEILNDGTVQKHGQTLNLYRLNNIKSLNNNLRLTPFIEVAVNQKAVITVVLVYDVNTENILYQDNTLEFSGLFVYGQ